MQAGDAGGRLLFFAILCSLTKSLYSQKSSQCFLETLAMAAVRGLVVLQNVCESALTSDCEFMVRIALFFFNFTVN
jgi:hypothetical protein